MVFTYRLCVGPQGEGWYDRAWCYEPRFLPDAVAALQSWDGKADPPGRWLKEVGTERRRAFDVDGTEIDRTDIHSTALYPRSSIHT